MFPNLLVRWGRVLPHSLRKENLGEEKRINRAKFNYFVDRHLSSRGANELAGHSRTPKEFGGASEASSRVSKVKVVFPPRSVAMEGSKVLVMTREEIFQGS